MAEELGADLRAADLLLARMLSRASLEKRRRLRPARPDRPVRMPNVVHLMEDVREVLFRENRAVPVEHLVHVDHRLHEHALPQIAHPLDERPVAVAEAGLDLVLKLVGEAVAIRVVVVLPQARAERLCRRGKRSHTRDACRLLSFHRVLPVPGPDRRQEVLAAPRLVAGEHVIDVMGEERVAGNGRRYRVRHVVPRPVDMVLGACRRRRAQLADTQVTVDELGNEADEVGSSCCHGETSLQGYISGFYGYFSLAGEGSENGREYGRHAEINRAPQC